MNEQEFHYKGEMLYKDEILPEIEIRELVDSNELPSFVCFSDEDISYYLKQFFPHKKRQIPLRDMLTPKDRDIPDNVVLGVDASRENAEDTKTYLKDLEVAMKAPNYILQQAEKKKLQVPFKVGEVRDGLYTDAPCAIQLDAGDGDITRLIADDNVALPVVSAVLNKVYKLKWTNASDIQEWLKYLSPPLEDIINKELTSKPDLDTLTNVLAKYNIDIDKLDIDGVQQLGELLSQLGDEEILDEPKVPRHDPFIKLGRGIQFSSVCHALVQRLASYDPNVVLEILTSVMVPVATDGLQPEISQIVTDLEAGTTSLEEVQQQVKSWLVQEDSKIVSQFLSDVQHFSLPDSEAFEDPQHFTEAPQTFVQNYTDLAEFVKGDDTTEYDGTPFLTPIDVYDELMNEALPILKDVYDTIDPMIATIASEGAQEIIADIFTDIQRVVDASGLPCQFVATLQEVAQSIHRSSRIQQLSELFPDIEEINLETLKDAGVHTQMLKVINHTYAEDRKAAIISFLTRWWLALLHAAVTGSLDFNVATQAAPQYAHLYAPIGFPAVKTATSGIILYIAAVVEEVLEIAADDATEAVLEFAQETFSERLEEIAERSKEVRKTTDQAELAKMSLIETIKALKTNKNISILPSYLTAFLYLPALLPQQKGINRRQISWMQGCCLTSVSEQFEADGDWKQRLAALYSMKVELAKDRWLKTRPKLAVIPIPLVQKQAEAGACQPLKLELTVDVSVAEHTDFSGIPENIINGDYLTVIKVAKDTVTKVFAKKHALFIIDNVIATALDHHQVMSLVSAVAHSSKFPDKLRDFKQKIDGLGDKYDDYKHIAVYLLAQALCHNASAKEEVFSTVHRWVKANKVMTVAEITQFINNAREKQKDLSLKKLDVMEDDDRENMGELKKLSLVKLVSQDEVVAALQTDDDFDSFEVTTNDLGYDYDDEDAEGEAEFMMPGRDDDDPEDY